MKKQVNCCQLVASLLAALLVLAFSFAFSSEASAGEFVMNGGASYQFLSHNPDKLAARMDNMLNPEPKRPATTHDWTDSTIIYHGVMVDIQPEYRFTEWFGLGLDLGLGGMVSENFDSIHPQNVTSTRLAYFIVPNDFKHLSFEALLTFKFIAPLNHCDIWFEVGAGIYMLTLQYLKDDGKYDDVGEFFDGIYPDARGRIGFTFYPDDHMGIGFHGGASYLGWFQNDTFSAEGGIHFNGKF